MRTSALLDMFSYKYFTPYLQIRLAIDISNFSKLYHRIPHLGSCFDNIKRDLNSGSEPILQCLLTSEIPHKNNNNIAVIGPKLIPKKHAASFSLLVRAVARSTGVIRHQQRHFKSHQIIERRKAISTGWGALEYRQQISMPNSLQQQWCLMLIKIVSNINIKTYDRSGSCQ